MIMTLYSIKKRLNFVNVFVQKTICEQIKYYKIKRNIILEKFKAISYHKNKINWCLLFSI